MRNPLLIVAIGCGLLVACQGPSDAPPGLTLTLRTPERIAGSYRESTETIYFQSEVHGQDASATFFDADQGPLIATARLGATGRISVLGRYEASIENHRSREVAGDESAFADLFKRPEFRLMAVVRDALAEAGVTAQAVPGAQPLLTLSSEMAQTYKKEIFTVQEAISCSSKVKCPKGTGKHKNGASCICKPIVSGGGCAPAYPGDLRCDPNHNDCFGMCGPGCTCVDLVCGDCRWHQGCAEHDADCESCNSGNLFDCPLCYIPLDAAAVVYIFGGC